MRKSLSFSVNRGRMDIIAFFLVGTLFYAVAKGPNAEVGTKSAKALKRKCFLIIFEAISFFSFHF